ncbi:histidine triad nucleotide-binding protein [Cardiobacterium sp. AH-315-I02]|nr:histidine triad nucleotide-binding protein [Cardiobacterium sp. AH-315-I02]
MSDCLFCKIQQGEIPADIVFESDDVLAFRDVNPQAPTHILIIPRKHIATVNDLGKNHEQMMGRLFSVAKTIAAQEGVAEEGYRMVVNCNEKAGQTIFHIHMHLLAGRNMNWPPG